MQILKSNIFDSFLTRLFTPNNPLKELLDLVAICIGYEQHCNRHAVTSFGQPHSSAARTESVSPTLNSFAL